MAELRANARTVRTTSLVPLGPLLNFSIAASTLATAAWYAALIWFISSIAASVSSTTAWYAAALAAERPICAKFCANASAWAWHHATYGARGEIFGMVLLDMAVARG